MYSIQEILPQNWHADFDLIYSTTGAIILLCSWLSQTFTFISNDYLSLLLNSFFYSNITSRDPPSLVFLREGEGFLRVSDVCTWSSATTWATLGVKLADKRRLKECTSTKPSLRDMLKGLLRRGRKRVRERGIQGQRGENE